MNETAAFWAHCNKCAQEVATWPVCMRQAAKRGVEGYEQGDVDFMGSRVNEDEDWEAAQPVRMPDPEEEALKRTIQVLGATRPVIGTRFVASTNLTRSGSKVEAQGETELEALRLLCRRVAAADETTKR